MPNPKKVEMVNRLKGILSRSKITIFADFRGMGALEMSRLRGRLKEQEAELKVIKNNLARIALEISGKREGIRFLTGPTAIVFSYKDELIPPKILAEYKERLSIRGGLINNSPLDPQGVLALAELPPKDVLLCQLVGALKNPANLFVFSLYSILARLIMVLKERESSLRR